jgi:hypothetical protein
MNHPAATNGVSYHVSLRPSVLDTESRSVFLIPVFAGMTSSRQAAGNGPWAIQFLLLGNLAVVAERQVG